MHGPLPVVPRHRSRASRLLTEYVGLAVVAVLLAFLIRTFVGLAYYIPSESMYPTLKINDRVVVSRVSYRLHDPRRGDIMVFDNPTVETVEPGMPVRFLRSVLEVVGIHQSNDKNLIKRVVGLPGEELSIHDGRVFINGKALNEPYLRPGVVSSGRDSSPTFGPITIPPNHVFMMGDNRPNSADSRYWGPLDEKKIVGRAVVRVWPPWRLSFL